MVSTWKRQEIHSGAVGSLVLTIAFLEGCADPGRNQQANQREAGDDQEQHAENEPASADYRLESADCEKFQPGRPKDDVLEDVQWRGNLEMAAEYNGKSVSAISYGILGGPFASGGGDVVWALFVDDKFEKFVEWPEWGGGPIKVGDFDELVRAVESEPVNLPDLEKAIKAQPEAPSQTDPGLTAVGIVLGPALMAAQKKALKRNAELRDQFNAARLEIGMTESQVEAVLGAKPIQVGEVEAGPYKIYGSNEMLDVQAYHHFSNVLILFRDGKVSGIYSGQTVSEPSRHEDWESFVDLPLSRTRQQR